MTRLWNRLRSSMWFIPALMVSSAVLLALLLVEAETRFGRELLQGRWPRLFGAGADGARGLLATIAASMMTVAGTTFSITVVALTLASSQYSSRILRNFMRDRANQAVLGVFVAIFAYCLIVLRTVRGGDDGLFVPALAVLGAVALAFVGIGVLIFFIHHVADSLQATSIIANAADETIAVIERLYPAAGRTDDERAVHEPGPALAQGLGFAVAARRSGYVESIDTAALCRIAHAADTVLHVECQVGDFVLRDAPLARAARPLATEAGAGVAAAFALGRHRTTEQDAGFGMRQIVDVALKALSPGINDTTTAVNCIDYLCAIMARLAPRALPPRCKRHAGVLRVVADGPTFASLLALAFDQIRQNSAGNVAILRRLLDASASLAAYTDTPERLQALRQQAQAVGELALRSVAAPNERAELATRLDDTLVALAAAQRREPGKGVSR